jgi:hypothetical protein
MGFGREDAICELDLVMQIPPGSSDEYTTYKCVGAVWQYRRRREFVLPIPARA